MQKKPYGPGRKDERKPVGVTVPESVGTAFKFSEKVAHTTRNGVSPLIAVLILRLFHTLHLKKIFFHLYAVGPQHSMTFRCTT